MREEDRLVLIRLPVWSTLAGLVAGLALGAAAAGAEWADLLADLAAPVGGLWLRALQMTIIPLVAALLVIGISRLVEAAAAGRVARRMLGLVFAVLLSGAVAASMIVPLLLESFPAPGGSALLFEPAGADDAAPLPGIGEFLQSLVAPNLIAAAAETAMLPLAIFFVLFAVALTRLPGRQKDTLLGFFLALGNAMLVVIGWVLWLAPAGVFALAVGVGLRAGGGAFTALLHYIAVVSAAGVVILIAAYVLAAFASPASFPRFVREALPAQAVAVSTQSSLASLPAMLASVRRMGVREEIADFVLPLAVAIFRATSPAMNLAVVLYIAHASGIAVPPLVMATGIAVALIISIGTVSLPGTISFIVSIGPIALAMGVPVEPLALLVAVEMIPDIVRTLANVTMNMAVAGACDRDDGVD
jgi:Na+/H+-dicarboxylate symporter